jgi:prepilin-type N-terminal cleavage/methylation domain-containing protein
LKNNDKGFTLLEVMIAIALLSFVVVAIVQITGGAQDTVDRTLIEDKELLQVETAFARFEWDFSQIYSPLYFSHEMRKQTDDSEEALLAFDRLMEPYQGRPNFDSLSYDGLPIPKFTFEDKNEITFFTNSNRRKLKNIKQSHFAWVRYTLETDRDTTPEVDLYGVKTLRAKGIWIRKVYTEDVFSNEVIDWSKVKSQVLLRNVEKISFEFWDPENRKWVENIRLIKDGDKLFRGVRITMVWKTIDDLEQTYVRTFRPLYPQFTPEDLYKLATEDTNKPNTEGGDLEFNSDEGEDED